MKIFFYKCDKSSSSTFDHFCCHTYCQLAQFPMHAYSSVQLNSFLTHLQRAVQDFLHPHVTSMRHAFDASSKVVLTGE